MENEEWKYLLVNGKFKTVEVKDPVYNDNGIVLQSIKGLKPFDKKSEDGKLIKPTVQDALNLKRDIYTSFFRKPFKNFLILTGAGASMDVKGPSMKKLWDIADKKYKFTVINPDDVKKDIIKNGFEMKFIR